MLYSARVIPRADDLTLVKVEFGDEPANNDRLVPAAIAALNSLELAGGRGILFNGAASLPVALALAHSVAHLYQFVAWFDPKVSRYVVGISHAPDVRPGDLLV
ncbi:MAG: CRISPR-associated protein Csx3 [Bryobacterales bacterium]|nr:CRISPR-associated protein Csx3 [Bryobacterales bacterium]